MRKKILLVIVVILSAVILVYSASNYLNQPVRSRRLVIATTTSAVDSGLLEYIKPHFDGRFDADMTWLYLGTGQAIAVASRGDADVLLVHDREREDAFLAAGNGTHRVTVMCSDFVIVGPRSDPAGVRGAVGVVEAFRRIFEAGEAGKAIFVSRGDKSGTHSLELRIWAASHLEPRGKVWYIEAGQGMSPTLLISSEREAYTVSDRGTWVKLKSEMGDTIRLQILMEGDKMLLNPYGLILLNQQKYPNINARLAESFFLFMVSELGQTLIENYRVGGEEVFYPAFGKADAIGLPSEASEVNFWVKKLIENGMKPPPWV